MRIFQTIDGGKRILFADRSGRILEEFKFLEIYIRIAVRR